MINRSIDHIRRSRRIVQEKIEKYKSWRDSRLEKIIDGERSAKFSLAKKERNMESLNPIKRSLKERCFLALNTSAYSTILCPWYGMYYIKNNGIVVCEEIAFELCNFSEHAAFARKWLSLLQSNTNLKLKCFVTKIYRYLSDTKVISINLNVAKEKLFWKLSKRRIWYRIEIEV